MIDQKTQTTCVQKVISTQELANAFYNENEVFEDMRIVSAQFVGDWCDGRWLVTLIQNEERS